VNRQKTIRPSKWNQKIPEKLNPQDFPLVVDFGCGSHPRNPLKAKNLVGLDVFPSPPFQESAELSYLQVNSDGKLPLQDNSVDALTAFDVLEHLPRQSGGSFANPFIEAMNEIYRVLKPGGLLLAVTPCYPSGAAFQDPTHVNIITPETHKYFSGDVWARSLGYGFSGEFVSVSVGWYDWWNSYIDLAKVNQDVKDLEESKVSSTTRIISALRTTIIKATFGWLRKPSHFMWVLRKPEN